MGDDGLREAWDAALERNRRIDAPGARFNVGLLEGLRGRWSLVVRPDTSMFRLLFTRPGETGYDFDERVEVEWQGDGRVVMALVRQASRRGERTPSGPVVVTGDVARPENARSVVEALLLQIAAD